MEQKVQEGAEQTDVAEGQGNADRRGGKKTGEK